jgi:hypothetical protein
LSIYLQSIETTIDLSLRTFTCPFHFVLYYQETTLLLFVKSIRCINRACNIWNPFYFYLLFDSIINNIDIVDFLIAILTLLLIISSVLYDVNLNLLIYKDPLHIGIGRNREKQMPCKLLHIYLISIYKKRIYSLFIVVYLPQLELKARDGDREEGHN